jgi:hypothetical protein
MWIQFLFNLSSFPSGYLISANHTHSKIAYMFIIPQNTINSGISTVSGNTEVAPLGIECLLSIHVFIPIHIISRISLKLG